MTFDDVAILTNRQVQGIYNDVYGGFWRRYRDHVPDWQSPEWEDVVQQEKMLRERYQSCPLVLHMLQDLMDQLEARSKRREENEEHIDRFE